MNNKSKQTLITIAYIFIIVISFFKIYAYIFDEKTSLLGDNAGYYILGKSLADGEGYTNIHYVQKSPANHFPPGYPVLVSAVIRIFSDNILTIKRANGFFLLAALIVFFFLFRKISTNIHLSFVTTFLLLFNYHFLMYSTIMMSEISFVLFTCLSLLLFINIKPDKNPLKQYQFYLFILTLSFSFYIRTAGIALLGGYLLYLIFNKNWSVFAYVITGFIIFCIPWIIRGQRLGGSSYIKNLFFKNPYQPEMGMMEISDWFSRLISNIERYMAREIPSSNLPLGTINYQTPIESMDYVIGSILLVFIIWGLLKIERYRFLIFSYLLGTFGILLLWPEVWVGVRFMLPIVPLLFLLFVYGVFHLFTLTFKKIGLSNKIFITAIFPFSFLLGIPLYMEKVDELHSLSEGVFPETYKSYFEVAKWVRKNTKKDEVVCCRKPQLFYLYADRPIANYKRTPNNDELIEDLKKKNVKYVVFDQLGYSSTARYLAPTVNNNKLKFKLLKKFGKPETYLFEFNYELGYHGERKDNKRHGKGTYKMSENMMYTGDWVNDIREGKGTFIWPNGGVYEGDWSKDKRNGTGTYTWKNGNKYIGTWLDDRQDGNGQLVLKDGRRFLGTWKKGQLVKPLRPILKK